jgi:hypothetical protein
VYLIAHTLAFPEAKVVSASPLVDIVCPGRNHNTSRGGWLAHGAGSRGVWMHGMYRIS